MFTGTSNWPTVNMVHTEWYSYNLLPFFFQLMFKPKMEGCKTEVSKYRSLEMAQFA